MDEAYETVTVHRTWFIRLMRGLMSRACFYNDRDEADWSFHCCTANEYVYDMARYLGDDELAAVYGGSVWELERGDGAYDTTT